MATTKSNDNIVTAEVEEVYVLPEYVIKKPTFDQLLTQYFDFHFEGAQRFCFNNNGLENINYDIQQGSL